MKRVVKFFGATGLFMATVFGGLYGYDQSFGSADGILKGFILVNVAQALGWSLGTLFILALGMTVPHKPIQNGFLAGTSLLVTVLLLELGGYFAYGMGWFSCSAPLFRRFYIRESRCRQDEPFSGDFSVAAGRWRLPCRRRTRVTCTGDTLIETSNRFGAYDRERSLKCPKGNRKRVVVLGDSFLEGYLVPQSDRVTNLLENRLETEHLNFAINGTSPINYLLTYRSVACRFDHEVVVIGLLPANDFEDYREDRKPQLVEWPIYRPYWSGTYPNYQLRYSLSSIGQSIAGGCTSPAQLKRVIDSLYASLSLIEKLKADILYNSLVFKGLVALSSQKVWKQGGFTKFEKFSEEEFLYLCYSLQKLVESAQGKTIVLLSIPVWYDLETLHRGHPNRLDPRLAGFCRRHRITFIPLIPYFQKYKGDLHRIFPECDGHWSKEGERFVADILARHPAYRQALGQPEVRKWEDLRPPAVWAVR
ncbi:SGNH/GDSL hydrolase family protein [Larkinella soli]|uniref:SGNH/GDSL hydrolase family protein n=1 Tax=Larkinella soli TaxID=1770527 RepID=UPI000FFB1BA1|nr:SGNH/GDSL hydrolase family protein [Larkinella soli]